MNKNNIFLLLLFLLIGLVFGGIIGDYLGQYIKILSYTKSIGLSNFNLNLSVITLSFGFTMKLSLASVIGIIISIILFRKL